jgi:surface antigen
MTAASRIFLIAIALLIGMPEPVFSAPPSWAPAHGWRKKHDPAYVGYEGRRWPADYGVIRGGCDRQAIGAVLGGAVGGAVGARVGSDRDRPVAILLGTVIGAVIGAEIARKIDEQDRACVGHALELTEGGRPVMWDNPATRTTFILTPQSSYMRGDTPCRQFSLEVRSEGKSDVSQQRACRSREGNWQMVGR